FEIAMIDPTDKDAKKPLVLDAKFPFSIGEGIDSTVKKFKLVQLKKPKPGASGGGGAPKHSFQQSGGFALIVSSPIPPPSDKGGYEQTLPDGTKIQWTWERAAKTTKKEIIGLGELIHYSSFDGTT